MSLVSFTIVPGLWNNIMDLFRTALIAFRFDAIKILLFTVFTIITTNNYYMNIVIYLLYILTKCFRYSEKKKICLNQPISRII